MSVGSSRRWDRSTRRAAVALEFALAAPILVTLVSGIADYGWYLSRESELVECARDAARVGISAASDEDPEALAAARAEDALSLAGFEAAAATITPVSSVNRTLNEEVLTVTISVPYTAPVGLLPVPTALAARVTMLVPS